MVLLLSTFLCLRLINLVILHICSDKILCSMEQHADFCHGGITWGFNDTYLERANFLESTVGADSLEVSKYKF